ncbi:MAG TPA: UTP--glucose-1-phosphate uridylyltransferase [Victivallales bacterium]|nr:UTP--glucose-1-phosphate uridylyltransferase [Victivallales bacterium]
MGKISSFLERKILASGQGHLLKFLKELNDSETERYQKQLQSINWTEMRSLIREYVLSKSKHQVPAGIIPAPYYPYPTEDKVLLAKYRGFRKLGRRMIMDGKVALLTVAGGQGTRLGFDGPKGTYPITPVKSKSFFQYFAEKIKGACRKYRVDLKWLIMTSPVNKTATEDFFKKNNFFGMKASSVKFFVQGTMPAISMDGKLIMESKSSLALSPNGHGGTIRALKDS